LGETARKPYIVGIAGGTCSGKSTISTKLEDILNKNFQVVSFHMDNYYKNPGITTIAPITRIEYEEANHPDSIDLERIYEDIRIAVESAEHDVILIEGLFALYLDEIREQLDLKVFIDLAGDERLYRRIKRWEHQTVDEIALRYLDTVRFRHNELIEPTRWHADLVINGTLDANRGTDVLASFIKLQLKK